MTYKRISGRQYDVRRKVGEATLKSFSQVFDKGAYRARRDSMIRNIERQLKKMKDEEFDDFYEKLVGQKPEESGITYSVTINPERTVALVPFGALKKKASDPEQEKMRKGLLKTLSQAGKRVNAGNIAQYARDARDGVVKIGEGYFNVENVVSALRVLGKEVYVYKPKKKDRVLIMESANEDSVFIAPIVKHA